SESLRNSRLQKTYLHVTKHIKNLCRYEGAYYRRVRASGRVCPLCSRWCEEVEHRYYQCPSCGIVVDRDYGASFTAALVVLSPTLADMLRKWLKAHPKALAPNYGNKPGQSPASRDTCRAGSTSGGAPGGPRATRGRAAGRRSGDGALKGASRPPFKRPPP
ncbi:MAG: hypothetical protein QXM99_04260, partial [Thermofilum sp.]